MMHFATYDECPTCHKKCVDMVQEHHGKVIALQTGGVVCVRCGGVFVPKSQLKHIMEQGESRILKPDQSNLVIK